MLHSNISASGDWGGGGILYQHEGMLKKYHENLVLLVKSHSYKLAIIKQDINFNSKTTTLSNI